MLVVLISLAVVLALTAAVLLLPRRQTVIEAPDADLALPTASSTGTALEPVGPTSDDIVLVPLPNQTGQALIVGSDAALEVFDQSGLTRRETAGGVGPVPQLVRNAMSVAGMRSTSAFQEGAKSGRIVALAPETMKQLEKGKPAYDKAGNVLALVRGDGGKLKHVMRFDKAGAQAAAASNMATLAVTAALSQQLEAISAQLQEMSETLEGMVRDKDRERLAEAVAANELLCEIAESVRRRGITEADYAQLATLKLKVTSLQIESTAKMAEIAPEDVTSLSRAKRREILEHLYEKERLEYWLSVQVQADLARTRSDLLTLLWEHQMHPETAGVLNQKVAKEIHTRQSRAAEVGVALLALSDPVSQTRLDPVRLISRHQLGKEQARVVQLLETHGEAFAGPEADANTVPNKLLAAPHGPTSRALRTGAV